MKINWKSALEIIGAGLLLVLAVVIVLPNFLNEDGKARHNVGKTVTGSMNRAQQAYFEENNQFTTNLKELRLGIRSETDEYIYKIILQADSQSVMNIGQAKRRGIKSYVGLVYVVKVGEENTTIGQLCESIKDLPLSKLPKIPKLPENATTSYDIKCPSDFESFR